MSPLAGRTVVITRAADQAGTTAALVASFEATPIVVPLIQIVDEPLGMSALASLDLADLDWIVVTSPNGAQRVAPLVAPGSAAPQLAAVGSATAAALPRCDLIATMQNALGLLQTFPQGPGRAVVVQGIDADPTLVEGLVERGWTVEAICPYRAVPATPSPEQQHAALAADAVLFASGSAARAWVEVFGRQTPPVAVAIGDQTAAVAAAVGLKISAISADHSMYGMLVTLSRYFSGLT
ncbi:MAG: uroporphyrinogen-III synthase [Ilumatobacteraceae bacterium]